MYRQYFAMVKYVLVTKDFNPVAPLGVEILFSCFWLKFQLRLVPYYSILDMQQCQDLVLRALRTNES